MTSERTPKEQRQEPEPPQTPTIERVEGDVNIGQGAGQETEKAPEQTEPPAEGDKAPA